MLNGQRNDVAFGIYGNARYVAVFKAFGKSFTVFADKRAHIYAVRRLVKIRLQLAVAVELNADDIDRTRMPVYKIQLVVIFIILHYFGHTAVGIGITCGIFRRLIQKYTLRRLVGIAFSAGDLHFLGCSVCKMEHDYRIIAAVFGAVFITVGNILYTCAVLSILSVIPVFALERFQPLLLGAGKAVFNRYFIGRKSVLRAAARKRNRKCRYGRYCCKNF